MARMIDIEEMISFINSFELNDNDNDVTFCLNRITADIDEEYLMQRAESVQQEYQRNIFFQYTLQKLASICNENTYSCEMCPVNKYCNSYIRNKREAVDEQALKMIDLFCGAGGLSLGFTQEGFVTSLANDIQECCVDTYAHNHPETPRDHIVLGDIAELVDNIQNYLRFEDVDIIVGGPPCQGFSMANRQRLIDDPRNQLYTNFVRAVSIVRPPFFVMENVKGMLSVADQVVEDFNNIGYEVTYRVLNAKDFGVPQNRERLIYIGNNVGHDNAEIFDKIEAYGRDINDMVLEDALFGLRSLEALTIRNATERDTEQSGRKIERRRDFNTNAYMELINQGRDYPVVLNHKARYNNDRDIEIFGRMLPGDKSDSPRIADIMPYTSRSDIFKDKYYKLKNDAVCKTITAHMKFDCNMYIHPTQARGLTPREAARVQSYPDDYYFRGAYTKTYMQIGNSVPPLLGRAIAHIIRQYL